MRQDQKSVLINPAQHVKEHAKAYLNHASRSFSPPRQRNTRRYTSEVRRPSDSIGHRVEGMTTTGLRNPIASFLGA